jgi:hypothetical protein
MTIAAVMVHVDFDDHAEDRIRIAAEIAGRFNSVLIGVAGCYDFNRMVLEFAMLDQDKVILCARAATKSGDSTGQLCHSVTSRHVRVMSALSPIVTE